MQGITLIKLEKVNLFGQCQLALGAIILVIGFSGNPGLTNNLFPFKIPDIFQVVISTIASLAILGILVDLTFLILSTELFGVQEQENINL